MDSIVIDDVVITRELVREVRSSGYDLSEELKDYVLKHNPRSVVTLDEIDRFIRTYGY